MKLTVGPLPPSVYWRRRALLIGAMLVIVVSSVAMCSSSPSGESVTVSNASKLSPTQSEFTPFIPSSPPASTKLPTVTPKPTPTVTPKPTPTGPPTACVDTQLKLIASTSKATYTLTEMPKLFLTITNVGAAACIRDLGATQQELKIFLGAKRIWSSDDCQPSQGSEVVTLTPGKTYAYSIVWSGKTSAPGCTQTRKIATAGVYSIVPRLGTFTGKAATFRMG